MHKADREGLLTKDVIQFLMSEDPVKGANQHGNFCQACLPGSIQAAVAADDFIFIAVFNGTDSDYRNSKSPGIGRK